MAIQLAILYQYIPDLKCENPYMAKEENIHIFYILEVNMKRSLSHFHYCPFWYQVPHLQPHVSRAMISTWREHIATLSIGQVVSVGKTKVRWCLPSRISSRSRHETWNENYNYAKTNSKVHLSFHEHFLCTRHFVKRFACIIQFYS